MIVVIESPYLGKTDEEVFRNRVYAGRAMRDSIIRGETPLASHVLYAASGALDDNNPDERDLGIRTGYKLWRVADRIVFYLDYGMSPGMEKAMKRAESKGEKIVKRYIGLNKE